LSLFSILSCVLFANLYLSESSHQFLEDFKKQNFEELASADTFSLARRLNALSESAHSRCTIGKRAETIFFKYVEGSCMGGPFSRVLEVNAPTDQVSIRFVLELPKELFYAFAVFISLQAVLLFSLMWSTRAYERIQLAAQTSLGRFAAQVAHDIRAPLAALNVIMKADSINEPGSKQLLNEVTKRIGETVDQLLERNRQVMRINAKEKKQTTSSNFLRPLIQEIVDEKKMRFFGKTDLRIHSDLDGRAQAHVNAVEFRRMISNLLENSLESIDQRGTVKVSLEEALGYWKITIQDTGHGISPGVMKNIGERGFSFGKKNGSGLGIYHAKTTIQEWGGSFKIVSNVNVGTTIVLTLPEAKNLSV
jgi:signal transduction histidine kinase